MSNTGTIFRMNAPNQICEPGQGGAILSDQAMQQFHRLMSDWRDQNADVLEAGGLGDLVQLAHKVRLWSLMYFDRAASDATLKLF